MNTSNITEKLALNIVQATLDCIDGKELDLIKEGAVIGDVADDAQIYVDSWELITGTEYDASGKTEDRLGIDFNHAIELAHNMLMGCNSNG